MTCKETGKCGTKSENEAVSRNWELYTTRVNFDVCKPKKQKQKNNQNVRGKPGWNVDYDK